MHQSTAKRKSNGTVVSDYGHTYINIRRLWILGDYHNSPQFATQTWFPSVLHAVQYPPSNFKLAKRMVLAAAAPGSLRPTHALNGIAHDNEQAWPFRFRKLHDRTQNPIVNLRLVRLP